MSFGGWRFPSSLMRFQGIENLKRTTVAMMFPETLTSALAIVNSNEGELVPDNSRCTEHIVAVVHCEEGSQSIEIAVQNFRAHKRNELH